MSRIVFMNVSAAGHVIPTLGLMTELISRGEEVIYYEVAGFQKEIEALGASFRSYPPLRHESAPPAGNEMSLPAFLTWSAREMLPALLESVRADKPDYIIHDSLCLWGRLAAELLDIPAVNSIASAAFTPRSLYECPHWKQRLPGLLKEATTSMQHFRRYRRELRDAYGIAPLKFIETFTNTEPLNICYLPPQLQPYIEKFDERFHFVGPCDPVRAIEYDFPLEQLHDDKIILISFGTVHQPSAQFYRNCIEAFADFDGRIIMLLSRATDAASLGEIPENFMIRTTGTVPQLEILKRASLFIMHGGGGGAREAAWHGVPVIAVPQSYEQEMISRRIEEQGAGMLLLSEDVTAQSLRRLARHIIDNPSFRDNSRRLAEACRAAGGAKRAADEIQHFIRKGSAGSAASHVRR